MDIRSVMCVAPGLLVLLFVSCTYAYGDPKPKSNGTYADRFNDFDWLISKAVGSSTKTNVILSPTSVKLALAMLYEGAGGTTAKELEEVLKIEKGPAPSQRFSNILHSLQDYNSGYELDVGMKLFIDKEAAPKKSFAEKISSLYNATIDSIDFKNTSAAVAHINGWAKSVTRGHIQHLLSKADAHHSTLMLLLNAVFFKGLWEYPFMLNATKDGVFMTGLNIPVKVQYMNMVQSFSYQDSVDLKSKIVRLPYVGNKFAMYIILPDSGTTLDEVIENLTPEKVRSSLSEMMKVPVHIILPKFNFEFATSLAPILKQVGIKEIFSNKADLRNIAEGPRDPVVSNVIQKAAIEVNELGTVAAVVTAVELVNKFGMNTVKFNASRPFLFFIEDEKTNTVIFIGKVVNPVAPGKPIVSASFSAPAPSPPLVESKQPNTALKPEKITSSTGTATNESVILSAPTLTLAQKGRPQQSYNPFYPFDIQLLQVHSQTYKGNWVISPLSIKTALGLLLEGASRSTAFEICQTLKLPTNVTAARIIMHNLQEKLQYPPEKITVKSGTAMLVKEGLGVNSYFRDNALKFYGASIKPSNFENPEYLSKDQNKWVKSVTNDYIQEIISPDSISPDAIMLLANAVYFKGNWNVEFNTVTNGCFNVPECTQVKMMGTSGAFKYGEFRDIGAAVLELPYENPRYSMIILLPNENSGLLQTAWSLPRNSFTSFLDDLIPIDIDLVMPKFALEFSTELKPILQRVGLNEIFTNRADFSELFHRGTSAQISSFVHRAKIEVTEKGTIAAGASVAQFQLLSTNHKPRIVIDRPFYFFIRDFESGFLFAGQIADAYSAQAQVKNNL